MAWLPHLAARLQLRHPACSALVCRASGAGGAALPQHSAVRLLSSIACNLQHCELILYISLRCHLI